LNPPVLYLACPYTDPSFEVRVERFNKATAAAAELIQGGYYVYSPITMTHPIDIVLADEGETLGSDYWVEFDEAFMRFCSELVILKVDGWDRSAGIKREVEFFEREKKPVRYIEPKEF